MRDPEKIADLACFINEFSSNCGKELVKLQTLCLRYAESSNLLAFADLQGMLSEYPIHLVVSSSKDINEGKPFFNYVSWRSAPSKEVYDRDICGYVGHAKLPSMIVKMLEVMQAGKLHLLRQCEYCGLWMHARGKNVRWCSSRKRCKLSFYEKTEKGREENATRQRVTYRRTILNAEITDAHNRKDLKRKRELEAELVELRKTGNAGKPRVSRNGLVT